MASNSHGGGAGQPGSVDKGAHAFAVGKMSGGAVSLAVGIRGLKLAEVVPSVTIGTGVN